VSEYTSFRSPADYWTILRTGSKESDNLEIPSLSAEAGSSKDPVRFAVSPSGEPRLLLPLAAYERAEQIETGNALEIKVSTLLLAGRPKTFLDLTCKSVDLEQVFTEVVEQILARVSGGVSAIDAVKDTLRDFRSLISQSSSRLERGRVAGLVAELIVLNKLLEHSPSAWQAWRGPVGDRHDFRNGDLSLEIKASTSPANNQITIHGIEQLAAPTAGSLFLHHVVLEPVKNGTLTVSGLGQSALARSDSECRLRHLLTEAGCSDVFDTRWNQYAFQFHSEQLYKVEGAFPRLLYSCFIDSKLPPGVNIDTYTIDLSLASAFRRTTAEFTQLIRALAQ
jgi:hypothetical protein